MRDVGGRVELRSGRGEAVVGVWVRVWSNITTRVFFFLMIRRPPRSTQSRSSAASDVYKRQGQGGAADFDTALSPCSCGAPFAAPAFRSAHLASAVSYTHLRAHETVLDLVCRLLLDKKTEFRVFPAPRPTPTRLLKASLLSTPPIPHHRARPSLSDSH